MSKKLIIFGNGLGMAINPNHFRLDTALQEIWNSQNVLNETQKNLIETCLKHEGPPSGEDELDLLHQAVVHCRSLNRIAENGENWLTENGQTFPDITAIYFHKVATQLYKYNDGLPDSFITPLVDFIKQTKSHVATLNYDKLLYDAFINNTIFNGYDGYLIDGMVGAGFSSDRLERKHGNGFGYYLHLHGSPLFVNQNGKIVKLPRNELTIYRKEPSQHIVLTHIKHKPFVIGASEVLSTYWNYFQFTISEAEEIILFGYSGNDDHLNILIRPYLKLKKLKVIEWSGARNNTLQESEQYWKDQLGHKVEVIRHDKITDFTDW
jgi:hypothetical protein